MAPRTKSAQRMSDRVEDLAAWVLVAAGLLVVLFSYGFAHSSTNRAWNGPGWRAQSAPRRRLDSFPTRR
jgi:hypothetical protein